MQGYRVLRFASDDVLKNLEGVVAAIASAIPPSLSLPHERAFTPVLRRAMGGGDEHI